MAQFVIEDPILNSLFSEPTRHFRYDDDGITDEIAEGRRDGFRSDPFLIVATTRTVIRAERTDRGKRHCRQGQEMRYRADLTAGSIKLRESRVIADLLLRHTDPAGWREAITERNVLQARSPASAQRLTRLIRGRLGLMGEDLWRLVRDGDGAVATHAVLAAAIKHSPLLGDFLDLVVRDQFRLFNPKLTHALWEDYLGDCRGRDPEMPLWNESTRRRLRSSVFQTLVQVGYLADTKSLKWQPVHIARPVIDYLQDHDEAYVLRCIQVSP